MFGRLLVKTLMRSASHHWENRGIRGREIKGIWRGRRSLVGVEMEPGRAFTVGQFTYTARLGHRSKRSDGQAAKSLLERQTTSSLNRQVAVLHASVNNNVPHSPPNNFTLAPSVRRLDLTESTYFGFQQLSSTSIARLGMQMQSWSG